MKIELQQIDGSWILSIWRDGVALLIGRPVDLDQAAFMISQFA